MAGRIARIIAVAVCLAVLTAQAPAQTRQAEGTMQLNAKDVAVKEVLRLIADEGGFNIAIGDDIKGNITLFMDEMTPRDMLDIVVGVINAAYVEENGAIWVMSKERYEARFGEQFVDNLESRVFRLNSAKVNDILPSVRELLGNKAVVRADPAGNILTIKAGPRLLREAEQLIRAVDRPAETRVFTLTAIPVAMAQGILSKMVTGHATIVEDPINGQLLVTATESELDRIGEILDRLDVGEAMEPAILDIGYAHPDSLAEKLRPHLTPEIGTIYSDAQARKLVIMDFPSVTHNIETLAAAFDVPLQQVQIEAQIIQVTTSRTVRSGIDWTTVQDKINIEGSFPQLADTEPGVRGDFGSLSAGKYQVLVEALESYGDTKLLSNPRLVVADGNTGFIHVGSQVPYTTVATRETSAGTVNQFEEVVVVDVGIKLEVEVHISAGDMISMRVHPEVSSVSGYSESGVPIIEASTADSGLIVADGNTVIVGGLMRDEHRTTRKGVPLLSRIPLLKYLFSSNVDEMYKSELVILLTPRIMNGREAPDARDMELWDNE